jgi:hypothetical protein
VEFKPKNFELVCWSKEFNNKMQQNSSGEVWVKLHGLSQDYLGPNILVAIASSLGTPFEPLDNLLGFC